MVSTSISRQGAEYTVIYYPRSVSNKEQICGSRVRLEILNFNHVLLGVSFRLHLGVELEYIASSYANGESAPDFMALITSSVRCWLCCHPVCTPTPSFRSRQAHNHNRSGKEESTKELAPPHRDGENDNKQKAGKSAATDFPPLHWMLIYLRSHPHNSSTSEKYNFLTERANSILSLPSFGESEVVNLKLRRNR